MARAKPMVAGVVAAAMLMSGACGRGVVVPADEASALRAVWEAVRRNKLTTPGGAVREDLLELIPTKGTWLEGLYVVGVRHAERPLVGGPAYWQAYLVGVNLLGGRDARLGTLYVTTDFRTAFQWRVRQKPPKTEAEALEIAMCFARLETFTRPDKLKVLRGADDAAEILAGLAKHDAALAESVKKQIAAPRVQAHRVVGLRKRVYTVEFTARSADFWGDICFWHMEIGEEVFSASRRPVLVAARGME